MIWQTQRALTTRGASPSVVKTGPPSLMGLGAELAKKCTNFEMELEVTLPLLNFLELYKSYTVLYTHWLRLDESNGEDKVILV